MLLGNGLYPVVKQAEHLALDYLRFEPDAIFLHARRAIHEVRDGELLVVLGQVSEFKLLWYLNDVPAVRPLAADLHLAPVYLSLPEAASVSTPGVVHLFLLRSQRHEHRVAYGGFYTYAN